MSESETQKATHQVEKNQVDRAANVDVSPEALKAEIARLQSDIAGLRAALPGVGLHVDRDGADEVYLAPLSEHSHAPVTDVDLAGHVRYVNPAAKALFADLKQQGSAHPWLGNWESAVRTLMDNGGEPHVRVVTVGERCYRQTMHHLADTRCVRIYGADVTEACRRDDTLRRYELLARHSRDIVLFLRRDDGRILEANAAATAAYGYERDELLALTVHDLRAPDTRGSIAGQLAEADARGILFETVHRRKDGTTFPVEVSSGGAMVGNTRTLVSVVRNIDERKRAEAALQASETRYRRLFEAAKDGILILDAGGRIVEANPFLLRLTGCSRGDLIGKNIWQVDAFKNIAASEAAFADLQAAECVRFEDVALETHSRRRIDVEFVSNAYRADDQKVIQCNFRDITERKKAEKALRDVDRQKNNLLAVLSHQLRNPLAPIHNSLFILDHAAVGSEQAARAKAVIERQVAQLARIVDHLLDATRIASGTLRLSPARFDVAQMIRREADEHQDLFVDAGITLDVRVPRDPVWISGDEPRMEQAFGNVLGNAIKFTDRGGRVVLALEADAATGTAVIRVRDTGVGIHPDVLPKLFEPFVPTTAAPDRGKSGLGLGLVLVRSVVELHGGSVHAHSEGPGTGTEFVIRLPFGADAVRVSEEQAPPSGQIPPRRVLIIEDNVDSAQTLREVLELGGHHIEVAFDGPEGVKKARAFKPDVVFCDVGLPGMTGYEVAKAFRADAALRAVYLVALTGYARPEDRQRAADAGFNGHIAKPASVKKIDDVLRAVRAT